MMVRGMQWSTIFMSVACNDGQCYVRCLEQLCLSSLVHHLSATASNSNDPSRGIHEKDFLERFRVQQGSEDTCKNFALLALCCVFVPNSAYNIDSKWIKYVYNVDKMKKMNWNKVVLNFLIKAIRNYRNNASYLCGDMLFLVVSNL
jgi:hypothetical protein